LFEESAAIYFNSIKCTHRGGTRLQEAEAQSLPSRSQSIWFAFFHSRPYSALIRFTERTHRVGNRVGRDWKFLSMLSHLDRCSSRRIDRSSITIAFFRLYERFLAWQNGETFLAFPAAWLARIVAIAVLVFRFGQHHSTTADSHPC